MQIQLTTQARQVLERLLTDGRFQSADEAVEFALEFLEDCQPSQDSLNAKLREAHDAHEAGQSEPLDINEIKAELQDRMLNAARI